MYKTLYNFAFLTPRCIFGKYSFARLYVKSLLKKLIDTNIIRYDCDAKDGVLTSRLFNLVLTGAQSSCEYTTLPKVNYNRYITKVYVSSYDFIKPIESMIRMCQIKVVVEPDLTNMFLEDDTASLAPNDSEVIIFEFHDGEHYLGSF